MFTYLRTVAQTKRDEGASAVEYGLLVAAIAALIVVIVFSLGQVVQNVFKDTCDKITSAPGSVSGSCST
jgi:pilus assembly protein Flp/PilA